MASLRRLAWMCRKLAKQHVDDPDVPAAPDGADGYAEWVQIAVILFRVELEKSLRETEDSLNEMPGVLAVFDLDEAPHYSSVCRWEQEYRMRELRRLLRTSVEQAGWSGEAAIDASGFQRDQTSYHYRDRANYSLQSLKTTILIDVNSLAIKDVHYTTQKAWDGHIGMQVFRRNAEDLRVLSADVRWTPAGGTELGIHRLHVMGIAAVVAVFLVGLFVQAYRPRERIASMGGAFLVILTVSAGTVGFGVGRPEEILPYLLPTSIALVTYPAGRGLFRHSDSYSPTLLALVGIAAVPMLAFVASQLGLSSSTIDPHAVDGHYVMMAGIVFPGWRLAAWFATLPIAYYGLLSIAFPLQAGSTGAVWGAAAVAITFVAVAEYSRLGISTTLRRGVPQSN